MRARLVGHCFDTNEAFILPAAVETVPGLASPIDEVRIWFDDSLAEQLGGTTYEDLVVGWLDGRTPTERLPHILP